MSARGSHDDCLTASTFHHQFIPEIAIPILLLSGYNNIAIEAAEARGIPVCTCPGVNAASVAEGALMMMLMLARRVHEQEVSIS